MKKFTILTFTLLLAACSVGPPYPNERERRAQAYDSTYYVDNGYRCYYDAANYPRYDYYGNSYYDRNGYRCFYYYDPAYRYDYYGRPVDDYYYRDGYYRDWDNNRNWDGS